MTFPRCGGRTVVRDYDELRCLLCGYELVPQAQRCALMTLAAAVPLDEADGPPDAVTRAAASVAAAARELENATGALSAGGGAQPPSPATEDSAHDDAMPVRWREAHRCRRPRWASAFRLRRCAAPHSGSHVRT